MPEEVKKGFNTEDHEEFDEVFNSFGEDETEDKDMQQTAAQEEVETEEVEKQEDKETDGEQPQETDEGVETKELEADVQKQNKELDTKEQEVEEQQDIVKQDTIEEVQTTTLEDIMQQIDSLSQQQQAQDTSQQEDKTREKKITLQDIQDDEVREQIKTFLDFYPEYEETVLTLAGGDDDISKRFVKKIKDSGDLETILALATKYEIDNIRNQLQTIYQENAQLKQFLQQQLEEQAKRALQNHIATIISRHPEMREVFENTEKAQQFKQEILKWAENKPHKEYKEIERIVEHGTAEEVVALLDRYKQEKGQKVETKQTVNKAEVNNSMAVKSASRQTYIPVGEPPKDDFDSAWDAITKQ